MRGLRGALWGTRSIIAEILLFRKTLIRGQEFVVSGTRRPATSVASPHEGAKPIRTWAKCHKPAKPASIALTAPPE
jgi:hypothetical protein